MNNKWSIVGIVLSLFGGLASIAASFVASKELEEAVDEAVDRKLHPENYSEDEEA